MSYWKAGLTALTLLGAWCSLERRAEARKTYNDLFWVQYAEKLEAHKGVKCVACHEGESKKNRNNFGKAVREKLGATDVKDAEKIKAAFEKAAKEPSAVEGKTFRDLIKEGKLPASKP